MQAVDEAGGVVVGFFGIGPGIVDQLEADGVFPVLDKLLNVDQKWVGVFRPAILLLEADIVHRDVAGVIRTKQDFCPADSIRIADGKIKLEAEFMLAPGFSFF